ncbi:hypothetical protein J437_LFUL009083 [Ladona fulva]|uniref:Uncharacterized protein n=1 Tax=Ladona fulva TaxID=123851 RepID=A0A8K0NXQ2_LADFU|nr:hypothetical protein J437_LFUL009083 [Ladona fulva]
MSTKFEELVQSVKKLSSQPNKCLISSVGDILLVPLYYIRLVRSLFSLSCLHLWCTCLSPLDSGSPTAAQQTIGFATPKVAATAATAGGSGPSALSQPSHPSPPTTASPALPPSSSPPSTTVHYPAVLKGRPVGISMAGSPAGSSSSTPGKPRIPPPVPPRSPKRPHHGQQSVRQGTRGLHRPRAEEERGGPLAGPGALRDTVARTSDFLYPSEHCSSLSTENAPQPLSSPATKAMTDHPDYPPRRIRTHTLSESSPVSLHSDSRITPREGNSPVVPPRRSHKGARKFDSRDFHVNKMDLIDEGNGNICHLKFSNISENFSDVSVEANKTLSNSELPKVCIRIGSSSEKSREVLCEGEPSKENNVFEEKSNIFDSSGFCIKKENNIEVRSLKEEIVETISDSGNLSNSAESINERESNFNIPAEKKVNTGDESDSEFDSKGSEVEVQHDLGIEVGIALSDDVVKESEGIGKVVVHQEDAVEVYSHVIKENGTTDLNREDELFSESLQVFPVASSDDGGKKLNKEKHNGLPSTLEQLFESPTKLSLKLSSESAENLKTHGEEKYVYNAGKRELMEEKFNSNVVYKAERSGERYDEQLNVSVVKKSKECESNEVIRITQEGVLNCGIHRAQMVVLDYIEPDKSAKESQKIKEHCSEALDADCKESSALTRLNVSSKICDKSAQLQPEDELFQGISNAHTVTAATVTSSSGVRRVDGHGTNVGLFSRKEVPISPKTVSMRTEFGSQFMNNSDAIKTYQISSSPYPFSHRNALPKPFSRSEIHGFGRGQSFRSVLPPSSPNSTASHIPPVINGYVDLEDVI